MSRVYRAKENVFGVMHLDVNTEEQSAGSCTHSVFGMTKMGMETTHMDACLTNLSPAISKTILQASETHYTLLLCFV